MTSDFKKIQAGRERQKLEEDLVHGWYRFVLAYPDHLVTDMLDRFDANKDSLVLDPFCGTGTTLVECKKAGIDSVGIDANPASVIASQVKTDWSLNPVVLSSLCEDVVAQAKPVSEQLMLSDTPLFGTDKDVEAIKEEVLRDSPEGRYLVDSGMVERGWIDEVPFLISIALLSAIKQAEAAPKYVRALKVALAACVVESAANVRFGPEIYVSEGSGTHDVLNVFEDKVEDILTDIGTVSAIGQPGKVLVLEGDSRNCSRLLQDSGIQSIDYVITSPPYPTEKDYTRQTRLELVYLGYVHGRKSLQRVKKQMVRSHSKGIYKADSDGELVAHLPYVREIADELREKVEEKTYGFAKLYPRIIEEYFGGMYRHFRSLSRILRHGGKAAYVVGEQCTYLSTFTPTGTILTRLAELPEVGLKVDDVFVWRVRQGTTGARERLKEEIVILEKA